MKRFCNNRVAKEFITPVILATLLQKSINMSSGHSERRRRDEALELIRGGSRIQFYTENFCASFSLCRHILSNEI
jgi:hypothetical protein